MKVAVNPLVVAAALGLLGPAALVDDDEPAAGVVGTWTRAGQSTDSPAELGRTIELIPVDDLLMLDDGSGTAAAWTRVDDGARQILQVGETRVQRTLRLDGDALALESRVTRGGVTDVLRATYRRDV